MHIFYTIEDFSAAIEIIPVTILSSYVIVLRYSKTYCSDACTKAVTDAVNVAGIYDSLLPVFR